MTSFTVKNVDEFMNIINNKSNQFKTSKDNSKKIVLFKDLMNLLLYNKNYFIQINELTNYKLLDSVISSVKSSEKVLNKIDYDYYMKELQSYHKSQIKQENIKQSSEKVVDNSILIDSKEKDGELVNSTISYITEQMNIVNHSKYKQDRINAFKSCLDSIIHNSELFKRTNSYKRLFSNLNICLENNKNFIDKDLYIYYKNKVNIIMNENQEQKEKEVSKLNPIVSLETKNIVSNIMEKSIQEKDIYIRKLQDEIAYRDGHIERLQELVCQQTNRIINLKKTNKENYDLSQELKKHKVSLECQNECLEKKIEELEDEVECLEDKLVSVDYKIYELFYMTK